MLMKMNWLKVSHTHQTVPEKCMEYSSWVFDQRGAWLLLYTEVTSPAKPSSGGWILCFS
jgi:hypothetical protein